MNKGMDRLLLVTGLAAVALFLLLWVLGNVRLTAKDLGIFDARLLGYTHGQAQEYLRALSPEQSGYYRRVFQRIDTVFPALLTFTLVGIIWRQSGRMGRVLLAGLTLFPLVYLLADYTENYAVARMLQVGPSLSQGLAEQASTATQTKWLSLLGALCGTLGAFLWGYLRPAFDQHDPFDQAPEAAPQEDLYGYAGDPGKGTADKTEGTK
jgi:hypothetical protein